MTDIEFREARLKEASVNFEVFEKILPSIIEEHKGQYALMKDKKILDYYNSFEDAINTAESTISDNIFSIQEVDNILIDLGFFSYAQL